MVSRVDGCLVGLFDIRSNDFNEGLRDGRIKSFLVGRKDDLTNAEEFSDGFFVNNFNGLKLGEDVAISPLAAGLRTW